jgi:uncharacterized protein YdhG (YjbR/CyaY superfamily)
MPKPTTIDEYISATPQPGRDRLVEIRAICRDAAPQAVEEIKWGHPAYVHPDGVILFMVSGHKAHASLAFTPSTRTAFNVELAAYKTGKGTVALPYDLALPAQLLRQMIEYRIREYEIDGIKWL